MALPAATGNAPPYRTSLCACGNTAPVYDDGYGDVLGLHAPKTEASPAGQRRPVIRDAYGASGCRYSLRTVTLDAALQRDNALNPAEQRVRDITQNQFDQGMVFAAPHGYALPKILASLLTLAEAKGWATVQVWEPTADGYGYVLNLRVGRAHDWHYDMCLFATPDVALETVNSRSYTPDRPYSHITPAITAIRKAITKNPVPKGADLPYVGSPHIWSLANAPSSWWLEEGGRET